MPNRVSKEQVIQNIQEIAHRLNKISLSFDEYLANGGYTHYLIKRHFGSVQVAFLTAGLQDHTKKPIRKEDIINDIQRVSKFLNTDSIFIEDYIKYGQYSKSTLANLFGNTQQALIESSIKLKKRESWNTINDKNLIIEDIKRVAKLLNKDSLSVKQYIDNGKFSQSPLIRLFGSTKRAFVEAGLKQHRSLKKQYTPELLLLFIKKFYKEFGYIPTRRDMEQSTSSGYPCDKSFYYNFPDKSWAEILLLAGFKSENQFKGKDHQFYDSISEMKIANLLYSNFIDYETHKKVCEERKWTCDFYLSDQNLWAEYNGLEDRRLHPEKYQEKLQYYKDNNYNFIELFDGEDIFQKLNLYIDSNNFVLKQIEFKIADDFLLRTHYLGKATKGSKHYGAFVGEKLVAIIGFGQTANPSETALAITRIAWLDLVRQNKNFGSMFISRALKLMKKSGYSGSIVSWSDPRKHLGTLYKACNFIAISTKKTDYIYVNSEGIEYHKSYCRVSAGQSESEYAKNLGLIKLQVPAKQKWQIII